MISASDIKAKLLITQHAVFLLTCTQKYIHSLHIHCFNGYFPGFNDYFPLQDHTEWGWPRIRARILFIQTLELCKSFTYLLTYFEKQTWRKKCGQQEDSWKMEVLTWDRAGWRQVVCDTHRIYHWQWQGISHVSQFNLLLTCAASQHGPKFSYVPRHHPAKTSLNLPPSPSSTIDL